METWIVADAEHLGGSPRVRGTRISVALILESLAAGMSIGHEMAEPGTAAAPAGGAPFAGIFVSAPDGLRLHVRSYGPRLASSGGGNVRIWYMQTAGGDNPDVWTEMLDDHVVAALTPYGTGRRPRPDDDDVTRICGHTSEAFIAGPRHARLPRAPCSWRNRASPVKR